MIISRPLYNYSLFDTEWLEPGKITRFFMNSRNFAMAGEGPKLFGIHTSMVGSGGAIPMGYYGSLGVVQFPTELSLKIFGQESAQAQSKLETIQLPKPVVKFADEPVEQPFCLLGNQCFSVDLPPVEGLPYPVPVQCHLIFKALLRPLMV